MSQSIILFFLATKKKLYTFNVLHDIQSLFQFDFTLSSDKEPESVGLNNEFEEVRQHYSMMMMMKDCWHIRMAVQDCVEG